MLISLKMYCHSQLGITVENSLALPDAKEAQRESFFFICYL